MRERFSVCTVNVSGSAAELVDEYLESRGFCSSFSVSSVPMSAVETLTVEPRIFDNNYSNFFPVGQCQKLEEYLSII